MSDLPMVYIDTAVGQHLAAPLDWERLTYVRTEGEVGTLVLNLPAEGYERSLFRRDGLIEVWRSVEGGEAYLDLETVWMIRRVKYLADANQWELTAYDLNHLLTRRIVDYNPGNTYTEKLAAGDDLGKALVRENLWTSATDSTRSLSTYLNVQDDRTLAPVLRMSCSRKNLLAALQEVSDTSHQLGTYLVFDMVCASLPIGGSVLKFDFRSYVNQRGVDRTQAGYFMLIGPEYGNLNDAKYDEDASDEITRGISTGQGVDNAQAVERVNDDERQKLSPFNLIESTRSAANALVADDLLSDARALVKQGAPVNLLTGKLTSGYNLQYGKDWNWGDKLLAQINGNVVTCRVPSVTVTWEPGKAEVVEPTLVPV